MANIMLILQNNYKIGMLASCVIVLGIYILISIGCISSAKKRTGIMYARGMIPIIQLGLLWKGKPKKVKAAPKKIPRVKDNDSSESMGSDDDEDLFSDMF